MAKALTRPQKRRSKTPDPFERELKRLRLSVCDDVGFRLYLATYDQPKRRDELIARVAQEATAEKVRVTRLDLAQAGPETNLVGLLRGHLQETHLLRGCRQAVMVTGIEQRLNYSHRREGYAFLHQANLLRDALPEAAPVPVVLWLSRLASAALPAEAPDLWHWRAANFDFTGDLAPRAELLRELTTLRPEDEGGLSGEQRQARVHMLEDLLAELEREGPPTSKRQKAERANLLLELGIENWRLGRAAEAVPRFERALETFHAIGDRKGEANALGNLGSAYADLGDMRRAIEDYEQALTIMREIGNRRGEKTALGNLGIAYAMLEQPFRATQHFEQQLKIAREIGDRRSEAAALGNLGLAYADLGEAPRAIEYHEQALVNSKGIGDRRAEGQDLANLGVAYAAFGEPERAIEHYERSLAIVRDIGDRSTEAQDLGNLGNAYYSLGEARRAIEHYEQALAIMREIGNRLGEGVALRNLGNAYAALDEPLRSIQHFEQQLKIAREIGDRRGEGDALYNNARALDQLGERDKAVTRMEEALRIYEQIDDPNAAPARLQLAVWQSRR